MSPKALFLAVLSLLLISSNLQADINCQRCLPLPEMQHVNSCCGMAYEESTSTHKLVATILISTAALVVVAIALWNSDNDHGHNHNGGNSCSHNHCGH